MSNWPVLDATYSLTNISALLINVNFCNETLSGTITISVVQIQRLTGEDWQPQMVL